MGPGGVEPPTSRLSGVRSNHLSYEPGSGEQNTEYRDRKVPRFRIPHSVNGSCQKTEIKKQESDPCSLHSVFWFPGKAMWTALKQMHA